MALFGQDVEQMLKHRRHKNVVERVNKMKLEKERK